MKKLLLTLTLLLAFGSVQAQTLRSTNWLDGDSGIVMRGGFGPPGTAIARAPSGDSLTWLPLGGATSVDSLTGLGTGVRTALKVNVGTAGAFVVLNGAGGTPSAINLSNGSNLPLASGISGFGTGIATALGVNVGSAGAPVLFNGAGGAPSSINLANGTALPLSGLSGLASGMATWLGSATSANLRGTLTDEVGTGFSVFNNNTPFTGVMTAETIVVDSINAGKFAGAFEADSVVLSGLNAGWLLTVNGDGKVVDNSAVKVGSSQIAFFNGTLASKQTVNDLTAFNPVTSTANFMTQWQDVLDALAAYNLLGE